MDYQKVFDIVVTHLRKQGKRAVNDEGKCMYRAPDGTKCAVGALIPDELYDPSIESLAVSAPSVARILLSLGYTDLFFIDVLQCLHDNVFDFGNLEARITEIATEYGLEVK